MTPAEARELAATIITAADLANQNRDGAASTTAVGTAPVDATQVAA